MPRCYFVEAATDRLVAAGFAAELFDGIIVALADLPGAALGSATRDLITIDVNAAGHGWFVDATPLDDAEFSGHQSAVSNQHLDLLTAVMHELGHAAGLNDMHDHDAEDDLMYWSLEGGVRRTLLEASLADEAIAGY